MSFELWKDGEFAGDYDGDTETGVIVSIHADGMTYDVDYSTYGGYVVIPVEKRHIKVNYTMDNEKKKVNVGFRKVDCCSTGNKNIRVDIDNEFVFKDHVIKCCPFCGGKLKIEEKEN